MCQFVPEFVLETKMSHHIFNRTRCLQAVKFSIWRKYIDKASSYSSKPILSSSIYLHLIQIKYIFIFAICEPDKRLVFKTRLQQGIWEPVFYGDLIYKFKRIVGKLTVSGQFKKVSNVMKNWDITWIKCESLHAWLFVSLRPINNLSVKQGRVLLG